MPEHDDWPASWRNRHREDRVWAKHLLVSLVAKRLKGNQWPTDVYVGEQVEPAYEAGRIHGWGYLLDSLPTTHVVVASLLVVTMGAHLATTPYDVDRLSIGAASLVVTLLAVVALAVDIMPKLASRPRLVRSRGRLAVYAVTLAAALTAQVAAIPTTNRILDGVFRVGTAFIAAGTIFLVGASIRASSWARRFQIGALLLAIGTAAVGAFHLLAAFVEQHDTFTAITSAALGLALVAAAVVLSKSADRLTLDENLPATPESVSDPEDPSLVGLAIFALGGPPAVGSKLYAAAAVAYLLPAASHLSAGMLWDALGNAMVASAFAASGLALSKLSPRLLASAIMVAGFGAFLWAPTGIGWGHLPDPARLVLFWIGFFVLIGFGSLAWGSGILLAAVRSQQLPQWARLGASACKIGLAVVAALTLVDAGVMASSGVIGRSVAAAISGLGLAVAGASISLVLSSLTMTHRPIAPRGQQRVVAD